MHILLVEDDTDQVKLIRQGFLNAEAEVRVTVAGTLAEARQVLERSKPELMLVDWRLPDGEGTELLEPDRVAPEYPVLVMSAHGSEALAVRSIKGGAVNYLPKSADLAEALPRLALEAVEEWNRLVRDKNRAEAMLAESQARFKDFAETAADWFWETDRNLHYRYVSERFGEIMGISAESCVGRSHLAFWRRSFDSDRSFEAHAATLTAREAFDEAVLSWRPDGDEARHLLCSGRPYFDPEGEFRGYRGIVRDATEAHRAARRLSFEANHDALTGLVNRREFERRIENSLKRAETHGMPAALCYMDLDRFKYVNDTAGHLGGDQLLRAIASSLSKCVRNRDTVARLGGDEFGLLLDGCGLDEAERLCDEILVALKTLNFEWEGNRYQIGASFGLTDIRADAENVATIIELADQACYEAKAVGGHRVAVWSPTIATQGQCTDGWTADRVREMFDQEQLDLYVQPLRPLGVDQDACAHYEVLLRVPGIDGPERPGPFLATAQRAGLSGDLDRWVVGATLSRIAPWLRQLGDARFDINLSDEALLDDGFVDFLSAAFAGYGVPPERICFEVREGAVLRRPGDTTRAMSRLRALGCRMALDDFGRELLTYDKLDTLPVDLIKLDGRFVRRMHDSPADQVLVEAMHRLGQVMGLQTIAKSVEDSDTFQQLWHLGVDYAQGYCIGEPVPLDDLLAGLSH